MKKKIGGFLKALVFILIAGVAQGTVGGVFGFAIAFLLGFNGEIDVISDPEAMNTYLLEATSKHMNTVLLIAGFITILAVWLLYNGWGGKIKKDFGMNIVNKKNILVCIVVGLGGWLINTGALSLMMISGVLGDAFEQFSELSLQIQGGSLVLDIIVLGMITPFVEEFLFRGAIQKTLSKSMSIKAAIIIQAILFGIYHGNLIQGIYTIFLGLVFGYVAYKCKSIWPAVVVHAVNNIIALTADLYFPTFLDNIIGYIAIITIGILIMVVTFKSINKNNPIDVNEKEEILLN